MFNKGARTIPDHLKIPAPSISGKSELEKYKQTGLSPEEIEKLKISEDYWHREALKWAAMLGESKIKFRELLNRFGIPESDMKDDELEKFLYDNRQQDKEVSE
jgi:hypothetical protein